MATRALAYALSAATLLGGCADLGLCSFSYTPVVKTSLMPLLKEHYGADLNESDVRAPAVILDGTRVELLFNDTRPGVMDETTFVVVLDRCSGTVVESYSALPPSR